MMVLSFTGISIFNSLQYWALEYTEALNALLIQSSVHCSLPSGRCFCWACA
jgi:hypothetical protein